MTRTIRSGDAASTGELRTLYEEQARALRRHPSLGKTSHRANVALVAEFVCEARSPGHVTRADLPVAEGGTDSAPTPGDLMRASLGTCLAMGYRVWAARLGVALDSVEVDVTCELDARGRLGVAADVPVGWQRLLFDVRVVSKAPEADVRRVVEHADQLSPMLANLSPAIERVHALDIQRQPLATTTNPKKEPS
jgi:uncharacterized OsmC-like protein